MKTTRKKTKIVGQQTFINQKTGDLVDMNVIEVEERDANFHKLWLGHIIQTLDIIGNKKIKVVNYIMENINKENLFIGTQRAIADEIKVSLFTVQETMKALQQSNFLATVQSGVYRINPDVIFKGGKNNRLDILLRYQSEKSENKTEENEDES